MSYNAAKEMAKLAAEETARNAATARDAIANVGILQLSPKRFALIERSGLSWRMVGNRDETDAACYLTEFSFRFIEDGDGKPLNNLTWEDVHKRYAEMLQPKPETQK